MGNRKPLSLYIPCYNVGRYISRCLDGVMRQTRQPDEILIIDDGSTDRTVEIASRYPVRVIQHENNKGLAAARNTGLKAARNELVASLDADCVPAPGWLEVLLSGLDDPKVAIVGGKLEESVLDSIADRWRKAHMSQHWGDVEVRNPTFTYGSNTLVRKSIVKEVGWYDEQYRTNFEDLHLSMRLRQMGYDMIYTPRAKVSHMRTDSIATIMRTYWRWMLPTLRNASRRRTLENCWHKSWQQCRKFVTEDLKRRQFELIPLDLMLPFYWILHGVVMVWAESKRREKS